MSEDKKTKNDAEKKLSEAMMEIYDLREEVRDLARKYGNAEIGITAMSKRAAGLEAENMALKDAIRLAAGKLDELARHFEATARETDSDAVRGWCSQAASDLRKTAWNLVKGD